MDFPARRQVSPSSAESLAPKPRCALGDGRWVGLSRTTWLHEPCQHQWAELKFSLVAVVAKGLKMPNAERQIVPRQNKRALDRVLQLAHIPRPLGPLQIPERVRRQVLPRHRIFRA